MPPRTALLNLAIRRSSYVCRSCVAALGRSIPPEPPAQNLRRPLTSTPRRRKNGPSKRRPSWDWENLSEERLEALANEPPDKKRPFTVNYFEKDDKTGNVRRIPKSEIDNEDETFDEFEMEEEFMELTQGFGKKVEDLQSTLEQLTSKASVLEKILAKHGPPGAIEALNKALSDFDKEHRQGDGEDDGNALGEIPLLIYGQSGLDLTRAQVIKANNHIANLNKWVAKAMGAMEEKKLQGKEIARVWSYFGMLIPVLIKSGPIVPTEGWHALWKILSWDGPENPSRMPRINGLAKVMSRVGVSLSDEQQLLAIEAAFVDGDKTGALNTFKRMVTAFDNKGMTTMAYWELGVRIWSDYGDVERAERASKALLDRASPSTPADSSVLLHLIQAYCKWPATADKGFQLYRRMRTLAKKIETPLEIEDYDNVISVFLSAGHTDFAMYAFTDMMLDGTVDLYGKTKLPHGVKNQFFFGKWLKRLIGAGDLDGANKVLVFMQKNYVMAAAVQVNGLIGAWLRTGTVEDRTKAEKLALSMIQSRRNFVDLRRRNLLADWPIRLQDDRAGSRNLVGEELDYNMVPRATTETFVLLAENYRERGLFRRLEELFVSWKECEMPSDALMMNELMMTAVAQNRGDKAHELYELMVHENDIVPNADTFTVLFASLPINRMREAFISEDVARESGALARSIFRDMISLTWVFQDSQWRSKKGLLSEAQAKLMLHTFRKAGDFAGVMAALEGLRDVMGFTITRNVLLEMIAEQERIDRPSPRTNRVVVNTTLRLQQMIHELQKRGNSEDAVNYAAPEAVKDPHFLYRLLLDYYHTKIQQLAPEDGFALQLRDQAREELGVKWMDKKLAQQRWAELKDIKK